MTIIRKVKLKPMSVPESCTADEFIYGVVSEEIDALMAERMRQENLRTRAGLGAAARAIQTAAIVELMQEAQKERSSLGAYRRVLTAIKTLGFDPKTDGQLILKFLNYHGPSGEPYPWLRARIEQKSKRRAAP